MLAAGSAFSIFGSGFSPKTKVSVRGVSASSIQYVSPTEFRVTLKDAGMLDGVLIQVQNPDNSSDSYYSYMRGVPVGQSARPLLARTVPVFSIATALEAVLPPLISSSVNPDYFTALALQNPSPAAVAITIESRASSGAFIGSVAVTLAPGARISRELSEWFGAALPTGGYLRILSPQAVQILGLLGNDRTGVILPVAANIVNGPAPPPPADLGPSGGNGGGSGGGGGGGGKGK